MPIRALVLDFDGLILDTETPIFESWREAYRDHGCELTLEVWQHALGTHGGFDPFADLCALAAVELDRESFVAAVRERNLARCRAQPLLPGVVSLLAQAQARGL